MSGKLLNLLALSTLAVLATTFTTTPVNAVSTGNHHFNRHAPHEAIARKVKRDSTSRRCKKRSATTSISIATAAVQPTSAAESASTAQSTAAAESSVDTQSSTAVQTSTKASAVATSTSSASSPANTSTSSSGGGKLCLAWPNGATDLEHYATDVVGWMYSWNPTNPDPNHKYHMKFMPQLWGANQVDEFEKVVKPGYADVILGMNEPNEKGQSNMSPEDGAALWKAHIEPKRKDGYKTCSPATSSNPNGFVWIADMLKACGDGCTFDCIAAHWYDVKAEDFMTYMQKWHDTYKLPVYITEFAPQNFNGGAQPSAGDIWNFYQTVMPWIQKTDWIEVACPFGFMHDMSNVNANDQLMASSGQPTDLGAFLVNGAWAQ